MPRTRRLATMTVLALGVPVGVSVALSTPAHAITGEITSPSGGRVVTSGSSVSMSARYAGVDMKLLVDRPSSGESPVDRGGLLRGQLSGSTSIRRNGTYTVRLKGAVTGRVYDTRTFTVRVPPRTPSGVSARLSGSKINVSWSRGSEPDLRGYTVSATGGAAQTGSTGTFCGGSSCSARLTVPSSYSGTVSVGVQARRSNGSGGTLGSGTSSDSVTVKRASDTPGDTTPSDTTSPTPGSNTPNSPFWLPKVGTETTPPGFQYPEPAPEVAPPGKQPNAQNVSAVSATQWGKSVAIALVLLLVAAHLGTWARRLRGATADGGGSNRRGALLPEIVRTQRGRRPVARRLRRGPSNFQG